MRILLAAAALLLASAAGAQTSTTQTDTRTETDGNSAVKSTRPMTTGAAAEGANSFTENQAKERLGKAGYNDVTNLTKNDDGQWVGTAMRAGKSVTVALDYKGNITVR